MPKKKKTKKTKKTHSKQIKQTKEKNNKTLIIITISLIIFFAILYKINKPKEKPPEETIQTPSNKISTETQLLIPVNATYQLNIQKEDPESPLT